MDSKPRSEIPLVIALLTSAASPDVQKDAVLSFFASDAGFKHPLCAIDPAPDSRQAILAVYRWYGVLSSNVDVEISTIVFDEQKLLLFLDVTQHFHVRGSPFAPHVGRLTIKLRLREELDGKYCIAFQENFFHPDEATALVFPLLAPVIYVFLGLAALFYVIASSTAGLLGIWSPVSKTRRRGGKMYLEGQLQTEM
ncbi:hypothetical protein BKA93DRAFT_822490 [Sparassis latifolia]|uniref:SigF-like NTF2-like domain-containing protein n=1 Tax=Sparassis crispa TaxID=139825 RepID=A0A401GLH4_9APHY|nr:hypothetical protein SCP_0500710 [Sparassis crispa]GBE83028.1 hypothetical protein SCP_0500710 [Sparassis crispa]